MIHHQTWSQVNHPQRRRRPAAVKGVAMPRKQRSPSPNIPEKAKPEVLPPVVAQHDGYRVHTWPDGHPNREVYFTQEVSPDMYNIGNDPAKLYRFVSWMEMPLDALIALFRALAYRCAGMENRFEEPLTALHCWEWSEPNRTLLREAEASWLPESLKSLNRPYTAIGEVNAQ